MRMTSEEWKAEFEKIQLHLINDRGMHPRVAWKRARIKMEQHHGKQPIKPTLPLKVRLLFWWVGGKLKGMKPMEAKMSHFWRKVVVSAIYGVGALGAVVSVALQDGSISGAEWMDAQRVRRRRLGQVQLEHDGHCAFAQGRDRRRATGLIGHPRSRRRRSHDGAAQQ